MQETGKNAHEQQEYVGLLISRMHTDIHERPSARETLNEMVESDRHAADCLQRTAENATCNCGIKEAQTFLNAEV